MDSQEDLERKLRVALKRQGVPPDFLANVIRRAELEDAARWESGSGKLVSISWSWHKWLSHKWLSRKSLRRKSAVLAIAAGVVVAAVVPLTIVERRRYEQAVVAHRQLVEALQITRSKLVATKLRIQRKHS